MQPQTAIRFENNSFLERLFRRLTVPVLVIFVFTIWFANRANIEAALVLGILFLSLFILQYTYTLRYYITHISWSADEQITISYLDFGKPKQVETSISKIMIYKGLLWSKHNRQPYLTLKCLTPEVEITQFTTGDWSEGTIDQLLLSWPLPIAYR